MDEILEKFRKLDIAKDVLQILYKDETFLRRLYSIQDSGVLCKKISRFIKLEIINFILSGYKVKRGGLILANYLKDNGNFDRNIVYLAHKITHLGVTTHYFSLLAESFSPFLQPRDNLHRDVIQASLESFPQSKYRCLRLCLAILSELHRIENIKKYLDDNLAFTQSQDILDMPPLTILLIKAAAIYDD